MNFLCLSDAEMAALMIFARAGMLVFVGEEPDFSDLSAILRAPEVFAELAAKLRQANISRELRV